MRAQLQVGSLAVQAFGNEPSEAFVETVFEAGHSQSGKIAPEE